MDYEKLAKSIEEQAAQEKNLSLYHRQMGHESSIQDEPVTMADVHGQISCVLQSLAFQIRAAARQPAPQEREKHDGT